MLTATVGVPLFSFAVKEFVDACHCDSGRNGRSRVRSAQLQVLLCAQAPYPWKKKCFNKIIKIIIILYINNFLIFLLSFFII
jgi:hypothetical protein